jgi:hypothetical protein
VKAESSCLADSNIWLLRLQSARCRGGGREGERSGAGKFSSESNRSCSLQRHDWTTYVYTCSVAGSCWGNNRVRAVLADIS